MSLNRQLSFTSCYIIGNSANSGGALHFATDNFAINLENCIVSKNKGELYGGAIFFGQENSVFRIANSSLTDNTAFSGAGLYIEQFNYGITILQSIVSHNVAVQDGGGIYSSAHEFLMRDSVIRSNMAYSSGGIILTFGDSHSITDKFLDIMNCSFIDNYASEYGGVSTYYGSNIRIESCVFRNNSATTLNSGGLAVRDSYNCFIADNLFESNVANVEGGALYMRDTSGVVLKDIYCISNEARNGGGMLFDGVSSIQLHDSYLKNNTASGQGGAIWLSNSEIELNETKFDYNTAQTDSGSAISAVSSALSIGYSEFTRNKALNGAGAVFWSARSEMNEPSGLRGNSNIFAMNEALYGRNWVSNSAMICAIQYLLNKLDICRPQKEFTCIYQMKL